MATEAEVKRALSEIGSDQEVTVKLKDGTEVTGQLVDTGNEDTYRVEADGQGVSGIKAEDVEGVFTVFESAGPE